MTAIVGWPDVTGQFTGPAHFLRGANSTYVPDSAEPAIRAAFPLPLSKQLQMRAIGFTPNSPARSKPQFGLIWTAKF